MSGSYPSDNDLFSRTTSIFSNLHKHGIFMLLLDILIFCVPYSGYGVLIYVNMDVKIHSILDVHILHLNISLTRQINFEKIYKIWWVYFQDRDSSHPSEDGIAGADGVQEAPHTHDPSGGPDDAPGSRPELPDDAHPPDEPETPHEELSEEEANREKYKKKRE